jgi:hypothetical protein
MTENMSFKGLTFMSNGDWDGQSNHDRRLELQEEIKAAMPQIKRHRNQRRNLRKKMLVA